MKIRFDGIYSPQLPAGESEIPNDPYDCWIMLHCDIGLEGSEGCNRFTAYVTTPKFLAGKLLDSKFVSCRSVLVVEYFDWTLIEECIRSICSRISVNNWQDAVVELSQYFDHEGDS